VVLNAVDDQKGWFVSTMELQQVSLQLCMECRAARKLHLTVADATPAHLWDDAVAEEAAVSRVPAVQTLGVTWDRHDLPWESTRAVFAGVRFFRLGGVFNKVIDNAVWPRKLHTLAFGKSFDSAVVGVAWPESLERLSFGWCFNQPVGNLAPRRGPRCSRQ